MYSLKIFTNSRNCIDAVVSGKTMWRLIAKNLEQEKGRETLEAKRERPGLRVREAEEERGLHPGGD